MILRDSKDTATIDILLSNTHLYPMVAVIISPSVIPAAKPEPVTAAKTCKARFLSLSSGKIAAIIDSPVAEAIAAPSPCFALATSKTISEAARPHRQ
jgi:beta-phosphoglucomutase-like phosphatase (HAD superfamily)